jgi:hypothetical protein
MELDIFRQIYEKYSNTKFNENPSIGSRVAPWGLADKQDEANSDFHNFANAPENDSSAFINPVVAVLNRRCIFAKYSNKKVLMPRTKDAFHLINTSSASLV